MLLYKKKKKQGYTHYGFVSSLTNSHHFSFRERVLALWLYIQYCWNVIFTQSELCVVTLCRVSLLLRKGAMCVCCCVFV